MDFISVVKLSFEKFLLKKVPNFYHLGYIEKLLDNNFCIGVGYGVYPVCK